MGKVGIQRVVLDFQGRWEGRKTCFWFSSLSTDRLFPQPGSVFVFWKNQGIVTASNLGCAILFRSQFLPPFFFSKVLRKRYDSVPVSMMWA
jgi:hypothetical protein